MVICAPVLAPAQPPANSEPPADRATLQALLVEVRQLRLALERSSSIVPLMQLAIARYQMQQERVDRLERELRDFRTQLASDTATKERMAAALKQLEDQAAQSQDTSEHRHFEESAKAMRAEHELQSSREQQERSQDIEMANQLRVEQAKLTDLAEQLNQLDKKLQQR